MIYNIITAFTNLIGLYYCYQNKSIYRWMFPLPVLASFFYHLSETKHGLPGIKPFNKYSNKLLMLDRFFAVTTILASMILIWKKPRIMNLKLIINMNIGLVACILSERDFFNNVIKEKWRKWLRVSKIEFVILHNIWHIMAFNCLNTIVNGSYYMV